MTRETKVGLLVGVAIILLIGIIVSDYLSVTKDENQPDFTDFAETANRNIVSGQNAIDPEQGTQPGQFHPGNGQQISNQLTQGSPGGMADGAFQGDGQGAAGQNRDRQGVGQGRQGPINTPRDRQIAQQQQQLQQQVSNGGFLTHGARMNTQGGPAGSGDSQADARRQLIDDLQRRQNQTQPIIHYVKSGDSVWKIAQQHLGKGELWPLIRKANPSLVDEQGKVREGSKLVIPRIAAPSRSANAGQTTQSTPGTNSNSTPRTPRTQTAGSVVYKVVDGDSLWSIARQKLGNGTQYTRILAMNTSVLRGSPSNLKPGMELRLPGTR